MAENEKTIDPQDKKRRIAVGATVGGVLLSVFLLVVVIVQFVIMGVTKAEDRKITRMTEELQQQIDSYEGLLDEYLTGDGLYYLALMRGWKSR